MDCSMPGFPVLHHFLQLLKLFPGSSAGKESACNAGDTSSIPGSGIPAGEGRGYPLPYSWASLVAPVVKTLPAMQETWVQSLGWEDPLEEGKATHSSILAWRIPWTVKWHLNEKPKWTFWATQEMPVAHVGAIYKRSILVKILSCVYHSTLLKALLTCIIWRLKDLKSI